MSEGMTPAPYRVPSGIVASVVVGFTAGAVSWAASTGWSTVIQGYVRLDQLTMMTLGALVGSGLSGFGAMWRREPVAGAIRRGLVLGGVAALTGATLAARFTAGSAHGFAFQRIVGWALVGLLVAAALLRRSVRREVLVQSLLIAAAGGAVSGTLFLLPGPPDFWQAVAFVWFGVALAFACTGPLLWHAVAVVEQIPPRNVLPDMMTLREWPIHEGDLIFLGTAQLSCQGGRLALYPPAGGVAVDGRSVRTPIYLASTSIIGVGGNRYAVQVAR